MQLHDNEIYLLWFVQFKMVGIFYFLFLQLVNKEFVNTKQFDNDNQRMKMNY